MQAFTGILADLSSSSKIFAVDKIDYIFVFLLKNTNHFIYDEDDSG